MQVNELISAMLDRCDKSQEAVSLELGHAKSWASVVKSKKRTPSIATVIDVADVAGCDVCIIDRKTGAVVATVTPPRKAQEG